MHTCVLVYLTIFVFAAIPQRSEHKLKRAMVFPKKKMLEKYLLMQLANGEPLLAKTDIKEF